MAATQSEPGSVSAPVLILLLLGGAAIYTFGYRRAVNRRANSDYKKTKALLPGLRKDFWKTLRAVVKIGVLVVIGYIALIAWTAHDVTRK